MPRVGYLVRIDESENGEGCGKPRVIDRRHGDEQTPEPVRIRGAEYHVLRVGQGRLRFQRSVSTFLLVLI